jgi:hypothetical protein
VLNKYKRPFVNVPTKGLKGLYYKVFDIPYKEKFPLSATALVAVTDAWHTFDLLRLILTLSALTYGTSSPWWYGFVGFGLHQAIFFIWYKVIFKR